jgi:hypothetical protein
VVAEEEGLRRHGHLKTVLHERVSALQGPDEAGALHPRECLCSRDMQLEQEGE